MTQFMQGFFGQILQEYQKAGKTAEAQALQKKMVQLFPNSDAAVVQQFQTAFQNKEYRSRRAWEKIMPDLPILRPPSCLPELHSLKQSGQGAAYSEKACRHWERTGCLFRRVAG